MLRSYTWFLFGLCLVTVLGAMGWISLTMLRLDREEHEARRRAQIEERVRLALWRLDTAAVPLLAAAAAWPPGQPGEFPLPATCESWVRLRFRVAAAGPQSVWPADPERRRELLALASPALLAELAATAPPSATEAVAHSGNAEFSRALHSLDQQTASNANEFRVRRRQFDRQLVPAGDPFRPVWRQGHLLLLRHAPGQPGTVEGWWLDWPAVARDLRGQIADLLPQARLDPNPSGELEEHGRMLAALPVNLVPGEVHDEPPAELSPIRLTMLIAWSCMLLPALGLALLLLAAVSLSERRGAFVSAVTHELRTPLTTFRIYTEMLHEGMVPEARRSQYLATLHNEAIRLCHMVENVLAYARIERGKTQTELEPLNLEQVVGHIREELQQRVDRAGMTLHLDLHGGLNVRGDAPALERIVINLVDNACKYAAAADDKRIHIELRGEGREALLHVRDHGPGVAAGERRGLFRAFSKSASAAAHSAPGIGLGLALSRRLARRMGGDLRLAPPGPEPGACFELRLPLAEVP